MKQVRLTKDELRRLRWQVWEPLRRNETYQKEFLALKATGLTSFEPVDRFCERWRITWPISPTIEFRELSQAPWLADLFSAYFKPHSAPAAFVPCSNFIQASCLLRIYINPDYSRKQVEIELFKIYSEWLKKREFYGIRRTPRKPAAAFRRVRRVGDHIEIHLDLSATRRAILAGTAKVLDRMSSGKRKAKELPRLHEEKWRMAFKAYDLAGKTLKSIALSVGKKPNTVVRMLQRAALAIDALDPQPSSREEVKRNLKRKRKTDHNPVSSNLKCKSCGLDSLKKICPRCLPAFGRWLAPVYEKLSRLEWAEMEGAK